jgi:anti-sigma factor RsiW
VSEGIPIDDEDLLRLRDGKPDALARLAVLAASDPVMRQKLADWDHQDAAIRALYAPVGEEPIPARHHATLAVATPVSPRFPVVYARLAAALALVALGAASGWLAALHLRPGAASPDLAMEALRAYSTYAVEVAHPVEVPASAEAHLVTWLSKRLGHPITPPDFAGYGFQLLGGRVVPDSAGTAALMMYEDDLGRRITLYVAPSTTGAETAFRFAEGDGAQGFWWVDEGIGCALVGDLPRETLRAIAVAAYDQLIQA